MGGNNAKCGKRLKAQVADFLISVIPVKSLEHEDLVVRVAGAISEDPRSGACVAIGDFGDLVVTRSPGEFLKETSISSFESKEKKERRIIIIYGAVEIQHPGDSLLMLGFDETSICAVIVSDGLELIGTVHKLCIYVPEDWSEKTT